MERRNRRSLRQVIKWWEGQRLACLAVVWRSPSLLSLILSQKLLLVSLVCSSLSSLPLTSAILLHSLLSSSPSRQSACFKLLFSLLFSFTALPAIGTQQTVSGSSPSATLPPVNVHSSSSSSFSLLLFSSSLYLFFFSILNHLPLTLPLTPLPLPSLLPPLITYQHYSYPFYQDKNWLPSQKST